MTEGRNENDHYSLIRSKDVREWMRETTPLHTEEKRTLIHYAYLPLEEKIQWTERLLQETGGGGGTEDPRNAGEAVSGRARWHLQAEVPCAVSFF